MILETNVLDTPHYYHLHHHHHDSARQRRFRLKPAHKGFILWHIIAVCYYLCTNLCHAEASMRDFKLVDLSHVFDNTTIYWVTEKTLTLNVTYNGTAPGKDYWYQKEEISAATHGGTHLDSPCHFFLGRWCVSDIPVEHLVAPACVVDISEDVKDDPNVHLTKGHLMNWESQYGQIPDGSLLLIRTGWSKFWPDRLAYSGTEERDVTSLKFPSIKHEAAKWIVENRNIVGIGIDSMSIDVPGGVPETHITVMEKNIYGLENVNNLDMLPPKGATVFAMPMKLKDASGAPCRVLAQIPTVVSSSSANRCDLIPVLILCFIAAHYLYLTR